MNNLLLKLQVRLQELLNREDGNDMVEYALVFSIIALGATAGMKQLATGINTAFNGLSTSLGSYVS